MPILNNASDIRYGNTLVERVYMRNVIVWERSRPDPTPAVPTGYTQYDYFETIKAGNNGTCFLPTGWKPNSQNIAIELDYTYSNPSSNSSYELGQQGRPIIGFLEDYDLTHDTFSTGKSFIWDYVSGGTGAEVGFRMVYNNTVPGTMNAPDNPCKKYQSSFVGDLPLLDTRTYLKITPTKTEWSYTLNNVEKSGYVVPSEAQVIPTDLQLLLCTVNEYRRYATILDNASRDSGETTPPYQWCVPRWTPQQKLYGVKVRENGRLVKMYVPCVRNSDSQAGLWEMIDEEFIVPYSYSTGCYQVGNDI